MYKEVCSHSHFKSFICEVTLEFMLEHLRGKDREPTAVMVTDFASRYESLSRQLRSYTGNLRESIPLWAQLTELHGNLVQHLGEGRSKLGSPDASSFLSTQRGLGVAKVGGVWSRCVGGCGCGQGGWGVAKGEDVGVVEV